MAAKLCASLGHTIEEARPVVNEAEWRYATRVIVAANIAYNLEARAAALGRPLAEGDVERMTWDRVLDARTMTAAQYAGSIGVVHRVGRVVARFLQHYDVILSPTMREPRSLRREARPVVNEAEWRQATWRRSSPASASRRCSIPPAIPP